MSLVPRPPAGPEDEPDPVSLVQEIREEARRQLDWAQAARWRAGAIAEAIFGHGVVPRLRYARGAAGFQALVELEVPFASLERHREREHRFVHEAGRDEILSRVPTLFVFSPRDAGAAVPGSGEAE